MAMLGHCNHSLRSGWGKYRYRYVYWCGYRNGYGYGYWCGFRYGYEYGWYMMVLVTLRQTLFLVTESTTSSKLQLLWWLIC